MAIEVIYRRTGRTHIISSRTGLELDAVAAAREAAPVTVTQKKP